jgi:uncharacterized protein YuzE
VCLGLPVKVKSLLDVGEVLEKVAAKYGLKLPKRVITIDYGEDVGDLFVRFRHADSTGGEATADGKVTVHYDEKGEIAAVEIADIASWVNFATLRRVKSSKP